MLRRTLKATERERARAPRFATRVSDVRANMRHGLPGCSSGCTAGAEQVALDAAVTAELVACTLGARTRPELVRGDGIEPPTRAV